MRALLGIVFMVVVIGLGTELILRVGIAMGVAHLDNPANYAEPYCDDDYHKLRFLWSSHGALRSGRNEQHPRYGWKPIDADSVLKSRGEVDPQIAVFGDSFMAGVITLKPFERIAQQLESRLPVGGVSDYSAPGYGVDQIYLRFLDVVADPVERPDVAFVGIFLGDIDRVVEKFRAGPKPYFELRGDSLELAGVPITLGPEEWLEQNPPEISSYALALLNMRIKQARGHKMGSETDCLRYEKQEITRRLLQDMQREADQSDVELVFVVNYSGGFMSRTSWREKFLRSTLSEMGATYIDVKTVMDGVTAQESKKVSQYFYPAPNNHYNARGNSVVADALYEYVAQQQGWESQAASSMVGAARTN